LRISEVFVLAGCSHWQQVPATPRFLCASLVARSALLVMFEVAVCTVTVFKADPSARDVADGCSILVSYAAVSEMLDIRDDNLRKCHASLMD
jgi:hypothetical protein